MKVSVIIPVFNMEETVGLAIKSALNSSLQDIEVIVVNDASQDRSGEIAKAIAKTDPRVVIHDFNSNLGHVVAMNWGIHIARGEYMTMLDADDLIDPVKLYVQSQYLDANYETAACFTLARLIDDSGAELADKNHPRYHVPAPDNRTKEEWAAFFKHGGNCMFGGIMFRREMLPSVGPYDPSFKILHDMDFYARITSQYDIHVIQEELASIRIRANNGNLSLADPGSEKANRFDLEHIKMRRKHRPMSKGILNGKYMIATPFYEVRGYSPYIMSLQRVTYALARHTKVEFVFEELSGGSYIDHNRNLIANRLLASDCTHLIFIDSDMSFDLDGFTKLLAADEDVVGAAYPAKNNWENYPVAYQINEDTTPKVNAQGLIEATQVPTGFMKISREVFEKLIEANPDDWYWQSGKRLYNFFGHLTIDHVRYGEDISFNIRWQRVGGKIYIEPRCTLGHYGVKEWVGNLDTFLRKQPGGSDSAEPLPKAA